MIRLDIEEYCENCPEFEPDVDKQDYCDFDIEELKERCIVHTVITCAHEQRCANMVEFLQKQDKK